MLLSSVSRMVFLSTNEMLGLKATASGTWDLTFLNTTAKRYGSFLQSIKRIINSFFLFFSSKFLSKQTRDYFNKQDFCFVFLLLESSVRFFEGGCLHHPECRGAFQSPEKIKLWKSAPSWFRSLFVPFFLFGFPFPGCVPLSLFINFEVLLIELSSIMAESSCYCQLDRNSVQWSMYDTKVWGGRLWHFFDHIIWHNILVMIIHS